MSIEWPRGLATYNPGGGVVTEIGLGAHRVKYHISPAGLLPDAGVTASMMIDLETVEYERCKNRDDAHALCEAWERDNNNR